MTTPTQHSAPTSIDSATTVGLLSLTVSNLERSIAFYTQAIGFTVLQREQAAVTLGVEGMPILLLNERRDARSWPREGASPTGLYHFAILMPTRADLGRWLRHWLELGLPLPGQGDHLVSEALYLSDPDENGIEIYQDRPRSQWQWAGGSVRMGTGPVDIRGVLAEGDQMNQPWTGMPAGTQLGHIHLQVGDISKGKTFYHKVLGFDVVAEMPTALFISAGGYHHHIGMNTWHSNGASVAPADMVGLRFFTVDFASEEARAAVVARLEVAGIPYTRSGEIIAVLDPWQNTILLQVGAASTPQTATALITAAEATRS